jgi:hypothetical protein
LPIFVLLTFFLLSPCMATPIDEIREYAISQLEDTTLSAKLTVIENLPEAGLITLQLQDVAPENALSGTVMGYAFAAGAAMTKVAKHFPDKKFYLILKISKFNNEETYLDMGGLLNN